ncbi:MAG TPA: hypothetical protein VFI42_14945 [Thermomicrobiaceae bacterium]|nr:hypothetical protein [Thermomicrobiaceae bacterium]
MSLSQLERAADVVARECLAARPGENALLISDAAVAPEVRQALLQGLARAGALPHELAVDFSAGVPALDLLDRAMLGAATAVVAAVSQSLTYNRALAELRQRGGRVLSIPRVERGMLERVAASDVPAMRALTQHTIGALAEARQTLELRAEAGTRLRLDISAAGLDVIDGFVGPGEIDQLPAGVVSVVGDHAEGEIMITGPLSLLDELDAPIRLVIEESTIVAIEGGAAAERLRALLDAFPDPAARRAARHCPAEVGIGTNPSVVYQPSPRFSPEQARAVGMVHVGLGDDHLFPHGSVLAPLHADFLLPGAEVWLDGVRFQPEPRS